MSALRELLAKFTISVDGADKLKASEGKINSFKDSIKDVAKVMAAGFALDKIGENFKAFSEAAISIGHTSEQLGISTQALQQFQYAGGQMGVEVETMNASLSKFQKNAGEAGKAGAKTGGAFADLKIDVRDASGAFKSTNQLMGDVADKIAETGDQFTKQEAAVKIFGKAGKALIPLLNRGREGLSEFNEEFEDLGGGISDDAVAGMKKVEEATKKWDVASNAIKSRLVTAFLPAITQGITMITKWGVALSKNEGVMRTIQISAVGVGAAIAAAGAAAIVPWLPLIGTFVGIMLVIDDMRAGIQGHKSVISGLLDKLYGQGMGKSFFTSLREEWNELVGDLKGKTVDEALDVLVAKFEAAGKRAGLALLRGITDPLNHAFTNSLGLVDTSADEQKQGAYEVQQKTVESNRIAAGGAPIVPSAENNYATNKADEDLDKFLSRIDSLPERTLDDVSAAKIQANDPNTSLGDLRSVVEGIAKGKQQNAVWQLTNNNSINITADSSDPNAVGAAAKDGTDQANAAALTSLRRFAAKDGS